MAKIARVLVEDNLGLPADNASATTVLSQYEYCFWKRMHGGMRGKRLEVSFASDFTTVQLQMKKDTFKREGFETVYTYV